MNKKIVLISCVSKKLTHRAMTRDIYISTLFKLNMKYAEKIKADRVFVLSAKYGLLELDQIIEPYEKTLNDMRTMEIFGWSNDVVAKLKDKCDIENDKFVLLAGIKYRKYLLPHLKHYDIPFEGLRIGEQLKRLKELTA